VSIDHLRSALPFLFREAITLWDAQYQVAQIAGAMRLDPDLVARWVAKRGAFRPFNGRISDNSAMREIRAKFPRYVAALEQAMRTTVIETLESEIDRATFDIAALAAEGRPTEADQLREYVLAMSRRLDSLHTIDAEAMTAIEE
jgi:hypothetical protein